MVTASEALLDQVLADPPFVHLMAEGEGAPLGVWSTERECYRILVDGIGPGAATLETGSGISTILFAASGATHTCITPLPDEAARLLAYCAERDISTDAVHFEIGPSEEVLPRLSAEIELDVVFLDGNHGYPTPAIDCFYGGSRLRDGGLLVVDDVHLPAVAQLTDFLDADPRWANGPRSAKWVSYRRRGAGSLVQDWWQQPFWDPTAPRPAARLVRTARSTARRALDVARRRLPS